MAVVFTCVCGNEFHVSDELTRQRFRCLHCLRMVTPDDAAQSPFQNNYSTGQPGSSEPRPGGSSPARRYAQLALAAIAVLVLVLWLLHRPPATAPKAETFAGAWSLDSETTRQYNPLLASARDGVQVEFQPDGRYKAQIAGQAQSGQWRVLKKEGETVTVALAPSATPTVALESVVVEGNQVRANLSGGLGAFQLARAGSGRDPAIAGTNAIRAAPARPRRDHAAQGDGATYSLIESRLYMGGAVAEPPPGTKVVVNLNEDKDPYTADVYLWVPIRDGPPAPSIEWLSQLVGFVQEKRQAGLTTYVHCHLGVSRAGLVVAAYLMQEHHWTRDQALAYIRSKRPQVHPNASFMHLLKEWEGATAAHGSAATSHGSGVRP